MGLERAIVESTVGKIRTTSQRLRGVDLTHREADVIRSEIDRLLIQVNLRDRLEDA